MYSFLHTLKTKLTTNTAAQSINLTDGRHDYVHENGDLYSGDFVKGLKQGQGIYTSHLGHRYDGQWQHDKRHGVGMLTYAKEGKDGVHGWAGTYDGEWRNDLMHGSGWFLFANGDKYEGSWFNGLQHGFGIHTYAMRSSNHSAQPAGQSINQSTEQSADQELDECFQQARYEGQYRNGVQHGYGIYYYSNGDTLIARWIDGVLDGPAVFTSINGDRREEKYARIQPINQTNNQINQTKDAKQFQVITRVIDPFKPFDPLQSYYPAGTQLIVPSISQSKLVWHSSWAHELDTRHARSRAVLALEEMIKLERLEVEFEMKQAREQLEAQQKQKLEQERIKAETEAKIKTENERIKAENERMKQLKIEQELEYDRQNHLLKRKRVEEEAEMKRQTDEKNRLIEEQRRLELERARREADAAEEAIEKVRILAELADAIAAAQARQENKTPELELDYHAVTQQLKQHTPDHQAANQSNDQSVEQSSQQTNNESNDQPINQFSEQSNTQADDQSINQSIGTSDDQASTDQPDANQSSSTLPSPDTAAAFYADLSKSSDQTAPADTTASDNQSNDQPVDQAPGIGTDQ